MQHAADVEAFKSLEILIGVGGVMLLLSLLVTALSHMTLDALRLRTLHLEQGLTDLFLQLGWNVDTRLGEAGTLAKLVLNGSTVITREELVEKLLELAGRLPELKDLIDGDPKLMLEDARYSALRVATERPDLASSSVKTIALAQGRAADLASQIFAAFDSVMNRVSAKFTVSSRAVVCLFAVVVALALPLDTFDLLRRFSTSDSARAAAVRMAEGVSSGSSVNQAIILLPKTFAEWKARWSEVNFAGVIASALLLSLGAPFWFDLLKDLLRLRSAAAGQEERDRWVRLNAQPGTPADPAGGEKGDLNALGRLR